MWLIEFESSNETSKASIAIRKANATKFQLIGAVNLKSYACLHTISNQVSCQATQIHKPSAFEINQSSANPKHLSSHQSRKGLLWQWLSTTD